MKRIAVVLSTVALASAVTLGPASAVTYKNEVYFAPSVITFYPIILGSPVLGYGRVLTGRVSFIFGLGYSPEGYEGWMSNGDTKWQNVITGSAALRVFTGGEAKGFFLQPEVGVRYSPKKEIYRSGGYGWETETGTNITPAFLLGWRWLALNDRLSLSLAPGVAANTVGYLPVVPRLDFFMGVNF